MVFLFLKRKVLKKSDTNFFHSYSIISNNLALSLSMTSQKFFISLDHLTFNPPSLDLRPLGGVILKQKNAW